MNNAFILEGTETLPRDAPMSSKHISVAWAGLTAPVKVHQRYRSPSTRRHSVLKPGSGFCSDHLICMETSHIAIIYAGYQETLFNNVST